MPADDRLKRDFDLVENLDDIIEAREERDSAFADSVDAMEDIDQGGAALDPVAELTFPHPRGQTEEDGRLGLNVDLMSTPDRKEIEFDWQDSVEEMLPTDPEPSEGMGEDAVIESVAHVGPADLVGPVPSVEVSPETGTAATEAEEEEYGIGKQETNGGEIVCPPSVPVSMDSAMDTDSDELDFRVEDKFAGQVDRETAELALEAMAEVAEETERGG